MELEVLREISEEVREVISVPASELPDWWDGASAEDRWGWIAGQEYYVEKTKGEFVTGTLRAMRVESLQGA